MKISLDWIKDFVELPELSPQEMGVRFTLSTCEVEGVEETNAHMEQVSVVEITKIEAHPEADKLRLVSFETGSGERRVVCGAPNVAPGMKVPFAPIGTTLPGGFTLEPKKIRGVMSEGMLCAEDELGLSDDHAGLMELPADAPVGKSLAEYLELKRDVLLDIDNKSITHRPDLWGHYGMAREFSAAFGKPLAKPFDEAWIEKMRGLYNDETPPVSVTVDEGTACLGFCGLSVDGVSIKSSPVWMQQRLTACGMRPINNIVDISNYVMLELGMPNHIFDRDTVRGGRIIVRDMGKDGTFTTLDEMERKMIAADTMVCDAEGPSSIGGIMGGLTSSVKDETNRVFIEVANWKPERIRHTSTRLGLRTDASQRYEKSLDSHQIERTVLRILELLLESCPEAKVVGSLVSDKVQLKPPLIIDLTLERVNSILGTTLEQSEVIRILESLEYKIDAQGDVMKVTVPSYRATKDVEVDADLIEDVGRIYGFDKLIPLAPHNEITVTSLSPAKIMERRIQDFMVLRGRALEIYSYPLTGARLLEQADWSVMNEGLVLANALSPETDRMRPSLVPSLLEKASLNQKFHSKYRLFELGRSYLENEKNFSEDRHQLGIIYFDKNESPFMDVLNLMGDLLESLSLKAQIQPPNPKFANPVVASDWTGRHPHEFLDVRVMGKICGFIGTIHPLMCSKFKIKGNLVMAVLDMTDFMDRPVKDKTKYKPLPKFPGATFDCTVVAETNTPAADVLGVLKKVKLKELEDVRIVDVYPLSESQKTVTLRSWLLDRDKTLAPDFLKEAENKIVAALDKAGYPLKQG
ncbi:MAG: phenylalanine--tRNA ligase subunit beta [Spirochaetales bacterium]|uniref:Phenylalanine--tRNA ligase beta subunit n=1 Tax=Candidatus Thalassospirochaeta sargassi TaxID=3119039 RepID=A0AAJ1IFN6_9SPIO|nr:phenylalanine--tRNA ligase subunit beta [Spirochaetales bacterium]